MVRGNWRSRWGAAALAALTMGGAAAVGGGPAPAGASNTQVSAVGSLATFNVMRALFPSSINDINSTALPYPDQSTETIVSDPLTCASGVTYSASNQPPSGSGPGKTALANEETAASTAQGCIDLARSASPPEPHSLTLTSGTTESGDPSGSHLDYYAYALDGVDVLLGSDSGATPASPVTLTFAQIQEIYSCWNPTTNTAVTTWAQAGVGTSNDTIVRYFPAPGFATRSVYIDVLGFDPTKVGTDPFNHCSTAPIQTFTKGSVTYPNEESTEDPIIYNATENSNPLLDQDAIDLYSAGQFVSQWNNPSAYNATAVNRVAAGLGVTPDNIGNFDPTLTLANIQPCNANTGVCQTGVSDSYVNYTPVHHAQGTMAINSATISEANEWYSHLPAGDSNDPSDSTSEIPAVRYLYNVADTVLPGYNGAKALVGFDNQTGGTESALCHGDDAAIIAAQGFVPLSNNSGGSAPAGSDQAGATCREFTGLNFPGQLSSGDSWMPGAANT